MDSEGRGFGGGHRRQHPRIEGGTMQPQFPSAQPETETAEVLKELKVFNFAKWDILVGDVAGRRRVTTGP